MKDYAKNGLLVGMAVLLLVVCALVTGCGATESAAFSDVGKYWTDENGELNKGDDGKKQKNPYLEYVEYAAENGFFEDTKIGDDGKFHGTRLVKASTALQVLENAFGKETMAEFAEEEAENIDMVSYAWVDKALAYVADKLGTKKYWDIDGFSGEIDRYNFIKAVAGYKRNLDAAQ